MASRAAFQSIIRDTAKLPVPLGYSAEINDYPLGLYLTVSMRYFEVRLANQNKSKIILRIFCRSGSVMRPQNQNKPQKIENIIYMLYQRRAKACSKGQNICLYYHACFIFPKRISQVNIQISSLAQ